MNNSVLNLIENLDSLHVKPHAHKAEYGQKQNELAFARRVRMLRGFPRHRKSVSAVTGGSFPAIVPKPTIVRPRPVNSSGRNETVGLYRVGSKIKETWEP